MPTHGAELITVEQPTEGPSLNLPRRKSLPLSSQTQCHNSASRPPARRVCLEAFMCVNKCFSVMRFNNHLAGPPDRQDEGSALFFFLFKGVCCLTTMYYFRNSFHKFLSLLLFFRWAITVESSQSNRRGSWRTMSGVKHKIARKRQTFLTELIRIWWYSMRRERLCMASFAKEDAKLTKLNGILTVWGSDCQNVRKERKVKNMIWVYMFDKRLATVSE